MHNHQSPPIAGFVQVVGEFIQGNKQKSYLISFYMQ